ncbi:MAG: transposase [Rhodococcus sp. (in: high G+C Gram-positive bacteria)]|uniref:transposase n=1 Tax=Rhodococcus sp. TaxID=1831 RepID=UPI003BAFE1A4
MSRTEYLSDAQWALIEPMLPSSDGRSGRPFRNNRKLVEGVIYQSQAGVAWRDFCSISAGGEAGPAISARRDIPDAGK